MTVAPTCSRAALVGCRASPRLAAGNEVLEQLLLLVPLGLRLRRLGLVKALPADRWAEERRREGERGGAQGVIEEDPLAP